MAKKTTLAELGDMLGIQGKVLGKHGEEIHELVASIAHVVKHMATKDDIADLKIELKGDMARVQEQVNSIETQLRLGRYEKRLGELEEEVFGGARS